jgi:hypothetical protein
MRDLLDRNNSSCLVSHLIALAGCRMSQALRLWGRCWAIVACVVVATASVGPVSIAAAAEPLAKQIDKLIAAKHEGPTAGQADDAEFLRRAYLDFTGSIPSVDEARKFLGDKSPDKRAKLVERLIDGPRYAQRMTEAFHVMLMERRGDHEEWTKFLKTSFEKNRPWNEMVRDIVDPCDDDETRRGAAFFAVNRLTKVGQQDTDYPGLTRDVGRLLLGMDLQCAQCHNHLFINDYKQVDFQGLYTVFLNTAIRSDVKFPALRENLMTKKIEFSSVFDQKPLATGPRAPGMTEVSIPVMPKGQEYIVAPDPKNKVLGVPKFSPLTAIADQIASTENEDFRENIANRLWWVLMGRGIVDPLDQRHSENPPSHPELLKALADHMAAHQFDVKDLLHEIAKSDVYARSSRWPATGDKRRPAPETYAAANAKPLSAEQMYYSIAAATGPHAPEVKLDELKTKFVKALSNPAKEPEIAFSPSVRAALFLMNENAVLDLFKQADGNLVDRLAKAKDADAAADEMYLAVLSRKPTDVERAEVVELWKKYADRKAEVLGELAWALASSAEFCLNH